MSGDNILQPDAFFHQHESNHALDPVTHLHEGVDCDHGQCCVAAQKKGDHYADTPDEHAVKEEGDNCFTAGSQG